MNCKYSIVIPAYNEKCIKPLITNIQKLNENVEIVK